MNHPHKSTTHQERYFHIREPHTDKKGKRYKAATVFARKEYDVWILVVARCSETDNFDRAVGRNIARKRWFNDPILRNNYFAQSETPPTYEDAKNLYMSI